ncbi:YagK/YfjJ domain-containing protein [Citrobacter freundii]
MHTPYPFNPRYTMNWFLLSLLNDHLNQLLARYSRIQALRLDLFYQKGTKRFRYYSWNETEREVRMLVEQTMKDTNLAGFFWILESSADHGCHIHIVFYLDRHINQATYPIAKRVGAIWREITEREGYYNRCECKPAYEVSIDKPVNYGDTETIDNLRYIISYLAKEEQKHGHYHYGASDTPPPSGLGRPRTL